MYGRFTVGKKRTRRIATLLLALLLTLPAPSALAAESALESASSASSQAPEGESSGEESAAQPAEESSAPESSQPAGEESQPGEGESSQEEPSSQEPSSSQEESSSQAPEDESSGEESGISMEDSQQETFASYPLLVVGGHESYMSGEEGARFYPDRAMTRAEMAQVLYNLLASYPPVTDGSFSDVSAGAWYATEVNTLVELDVLSGYEDGTFRPNNAVTRAEFVTAVCKCFDLTDGADSGFSDVSGWASGYINAAVERGWIVGMGDGTFQPNANLTRAQVTPILNKALERTGSGFAADAVTPEFVDVPSSHWAYEHIAEAADPVYDDPTATITGNEVRVRSGPDTTYTILGYVNAGDLVYVLADPSGDWVQIRTVDGIVGYVSSQYVRLDEEEPSDDPSGFQVGQTVQVTAEPSLNLRAGPGTSYEAITSLTTGVLLTITSVESNGWLGVRTSGGTTGFVSGEFVAAYDPNTGVASGASLSATKLTLAQYQSIRLDGSVSQNLSAMHWESSNENVVSTGYTVNYGGNSQGAMLYGVSPGTATITFTDGSGTTKATCTVTVTAAEPVRFAYGEGNIVAAGQKFNLIALTDTAKTAVKFTIVDSTSGATGEYVATSATTKSQASSFGLPTNTVKIFKTEVSFGKAGTYTIRATSQTGSGWSTDGYEFTLAVTATHNTLTTTSYDARQPSGRIITALANIEGFWPEIKDDLLASGNPTVGHGYVVQKNVAFYNNMTEEEAYAQLVDKVNSSSFGGAVERFRSNHSIRMSQGQFDALTSFVYNLGAGTLDPDYGFCRAILNAADPTGISTANPKAGTVTVTDIDTAATNASGVNGAPVYATTDLNSALVMALASDTPVTVDGYKILSREVTSSDGAKVTVGDRVWYHVSSGGKVGWMPAGYVTLEGAGTDLTYADSNVVPNNLLQWNIAGGHVYAGLVYRRLCESKIFFFGNYDDDNSSSGWSKNTYDFPFPDYLSDYDN